MNFEYSEEQQMLSESISRFLSENYLFEHRQSFVKDDAAFSSFVWKNAVDLGWLALLFDEESGGFDGGPIEIMLMFECFGKHLVIEPFLETVVLFGGVLKRLRAEQSDTLLQQLISGELQGALAHFEGESRESYDCVSTQAVLVADHYELSGAKSVVYNAGEADFVIVSGRLSDSNDLGLFLISKEQLRDTIVSYQTVDGRNAAELVFDKLVLAESALLASGSKATSVLEQVFNDALIAISAEAIGAMDVLLNSTIDYTKQRKQFGVAIASFQVLQHRMANMFMARELAISLLYAAAIKLRDGDAQASAYVAAAKAKADKSGIYVAHSAIQLHGGIATTEELNIAHYLKRMTVTRQQFGSTCFQIDRFRRRSAE